jgi:TolB-like protein/Flp pilus assembly protein TadD
VSFFNELKRRNVFKVGAAYLVLAWIVIQIANAAVPALRLPEWVNSLVFLLGILGLPFALFFAWAFELTPEGIKKESEVSRDKSIAPDTGQKINFGIIGLLLIALGYFIWQSSSNNAVTKNAPIQEQQSEQNPVENSADNQSKLDLDSNQKSIAVLPFTNMAANEKNESFTLGIHDDLLTHLSKISALKVISRTSVLRYKSTQKPIADIANELGVNNILEGSVQSSGNQIRINVQLIDAKTDEHLWAEIYDRELSTENIFKIQSEISEKIAAALKAQLSPQELNTLSNKATNNLEAYNAFLQGRQLLQNRKSSELKQALALFQKATKLDPNYALAYVNQADAINLLTEYGDFPSKDAIAQAEPLITKALSINPLLAEAHAAKAQNLIEKNEFELAEQSFLRAIELNPNYVSSYHWYGLLLRNYLGRYEEALTLHRKAAQLDPLSPVIQLNVAWSLWALGNNQGALEQLKLVNKLAPNFATSRSAIGSVYASLGQFDLAVYWHLKALEIDQGNTQLYVSLIERYVDLDDINSANSVLKDMQNRFPNNEAVQRAQRMIQMAKGEYNKLLQFNNQDYQKQPENIQKQTNLAYISFVVGDYQKSKKLFQLVLTDKADGSIKLNKSNYQEILFLALTYKNTDQKTESRQHLEELKKLMLTMRVKETYWDWVFIEMLQENSKAAAAAYAAVIENKGYSSWIYNEVLISEDVKKQPVYIEAKKRLMEILAQQRQNLIKLQAEGLPK